MSLLRFAATAVALALSIGSAQATVRAFAINPNTQAIPANLGGVTLALAPAVTGVSFNLPAPTRVVVTYTAECAVAGNGLGFVSVEIVVDGVPRAPTAGLDDRFCSSDHTPAADRPAMHSVSVPLGLAAGPHTVRVRATAPVAGAFAVIDDSTIAVHE